MSPFVPSDGPREEKPAICGYGMLVELWLPSVSVAVAPAVAAYVLIAVEAGGLTCTVGTVCRSPSSEFSVGFASTMPMPPARFTSADLATRS